MTAGSDRVSRVEQKLRTRGALVAACRRLIEAGTDLAMPDVAQAAGVSEATAYRHFPDLVSLTNEALVGLWPSPEEALAPVAASDDPVERVAFACEFLLRRVLRYQGSVRAVIAATITRPATVRQRPGFRFGLIDQALDPVALDLVAGGSAARGRGAALTAARLVRLKTDLAAVVSAEALFSLTDLVGLQPDEAVASLIRTARTITAAALRAPDSDA